ncbi:response regulator [Neiella sp. HB171785]|uniref:Response regulator n=1 Tax=Neiella litorisoli TaxID=2771431 RepID=A0A8J6UF62_9GAMM|nr:response regulator [Neiella litorisoli]MBD1390614.1 response regulator [Neiella litorisoli]
MFSDIDNERLQEKLLDLLRNNEQVQQREMDAAVLLDIIQIIGSAQSRLEVIESLIQGLQVIVGHQETVVLERAKHGASLWVPSYASNNLLATSVWRTGDLFERVAGGEVTALFRPLQVAEFSEQEPAITNLAGSALLFGLESQTGNCLVVLLHQQEKVFSPHQRESIRRLKPMVEQRLQNLEFDLKLRDVVAKRTAELRESQKRLSSFARSSSDWFWEVDAAFRFSYTSKLQGDELPDLGKNLFGRTIMEVRTEAESQKLNKWFAVTRTFQERQPISDFEFELALPKRSPLWVRINGEAFFSEQGVFLGYRGTAKNISLRKYQDRQLSQQIQQVSSRAQRIEVESTQTATAETNSAPHVLLVDDCESSQMITQLMLVNLGFQTSVVESGIQALSCEHLDDVDLVLMDLEMPDMNGEEVSRRLRERGLAVPILALTGCSYGDRGSQVEQAGMNGFIEKPVRLNVLQEQLSHFFQSHARP